MTDAHQLTSWVRCPRPSPDATARLICLPYGGGGASIFRDWPGDLWPHVEVCLIQLPGREARYREPPISRLDALVAALVNALESWLDRPFAVFGHSMGALIAFELTRLLRRRGLPEPTHLFVSARRAPHLPDLRAPLHPLPEPELVNLLVRRYNGIPRAVLESADLMRMFVPLIRADLAMTETYAHRAEEPLRCPISAFGGLDDGEVTRTELTAWGDQTAAAFTLRLLPGGHFFLHETRPRLVAAIAADLAQTLADAGQPAPPHWPALAAP